MSAPRVSVIIANYNRADMLRKALLSVIEQSYQDFEIIVVDDGSHDHSLGVVETFRKKMPDRVSFVTHEGQRNMGIPATYQLGISIARGEYVAFLEHDDLWSPSYLGSKVELLNTYPEIGVVFSPYKVVGEGWFGRDMMLRQWLLRSKIKRDEPFNNFGNLLQFNNVATFSCFMTRNSLFKSLPPASGRNFLFDWWVLIHLSSKSLFYYDKSSYTHWRMSKQSTMGKQQFVDLKDQVCEFMEQMYRQIGAEVDRLPVPSQEKYLYYQAIFPYFLSFYRQPGVVNLLKFFVRSPSWAAASILSLIINYIKFR